MQFNEKTIWVTGASSGIGEAVVYELLARGATVIASSSSEDRLNTVKQKSGSEKCHVIVLDLLNQGAIPDVVSQLYRKFQRIDILIHVAGVSQRSTFMDIELEVFRKIMEVNFFGAVALTKAVLPYMIGQGGGQLAAVTSIVGEFGFPLRTAYSASKHAMHGFFESIQTEYKKENIFVSLLVPGRIRTHISEHALTADGRPWGKMDAGQTAGMPVNKAARKIVRSIAHRRKKVFIAGRELILVYIKKFLPCLFWRLVTKIRST